APRSYDPPQTSALIRNFAGNPCGDGRVTLEYALQVSCNTPFAKLGVEEVKADGIKEKARQFGFETEDLSVPLKVSPSRLGLIADPPAVAQSSIGQRDVRMTPLQGAMIAAAVANDGALMQPYLVKEIQAPDYSTLKTTSPKTLSEPLTSDQAGQLQQMMVAVVEKGTGTEAQVRNATVGGKTGTAEDGDARQDHEWFIGFAIVDGEAVAAVAVVLENAGTSSSQAASVAGDIMTSVISQRVRK
ncbi:MAG TPA: penicillin-binding transpeptidase domain-containing protein, partial [Cryptosporangiaceae bacterium]|nr:penicillin-binding transpeptidase domain-containing protein [Cryptosporangiaceae bacterium]